MILDKPNPWLDYNKYEATLYDFEYRPNWPYFVPYNEIQQEQAKEESDYQESRLP